MKIGFLQFAPRFQDKAANLDKIRSLVAAARGAELLVLPEMCTTGYMIKSREELSELAENMDNSPTIRTLTEIAKAGDVCLIAGLPEIAGGKFFNTAVAVGPDGLAAKRQKAHLFLAEKKYFQPGGNGPEIFTWRGARIGLGVCYDYMFPEFWRKLALGGADLFCNIANFVYDYGFQAMRVRSLENGVFSITVNRSGTERGQKFRGGSELIDNRGQLIKKADSDEELYVYELDLTESANKRWNDYNDLLADRRTDLY